ncbi:hypothetical protein OIU78_006729 [Salix suchowensis]|nr:hypothetical protein OIU78_006729 [Salix suchowensis]
MTLRFHRNRFKGISQCRNQNWTGLLIFSQRAPRLSSKLHVCGMLMRQRKGAHGICILTEWDEFKTLDYQKIYDDMQKPAFVFDGRNVVDAEKLREIGFIVYSIGKPLDSWLKDMPAVA